jgi:type VII secretion system (Wss) protein YukD
MVAHNARLAGGCGGRDTAHTRALIFANAGPFWRMYQAVGDVNIEVWDATGNKRLKVQVPDDVAVERILMVLADKLHLPKYAPDGQLMSYKFHHRRLGVQLLDDQTLAQQHVTNDDVVRIQPEITAG